MWSYYGSKSKIVNLYPPPKYGKIIEPFAGTARYALKYFDRDILLVDKYDIVIEIWHYLQQASPKDILSLPITKRGDKIEKYNLSQVEKNLLGFIATGAVGRPRKTVSLFGEYSHGNQNVYKRIASNLYKIKHWKIIQGEYLDIENQEATWFIDPPYQVGGYEYKHHELDYASLSDWCLSRSGQIIVCENTKANWMTFMPLKKIQGVNNTGTTEAVYTNTPSRQLGFMALAQSNTASSRLFEGWGDLPAVANQSESESPA